MLFYFKYIRISCKNIFASRDIIYLCQMTKITCIKFSYAVTLRQKKNGFCKPLTYYFLLYGDYMIPRIERSEKKFSPICNIRCCKFTEPEAIFLKKLHYWISRGEYGIEYDDKVWIYNTLEQWAEQLGVSKSTFQRHIKKLREEGIVETAYLARNRRDRTLHYTINYEKYNQKIEEQMAKRQSICKRNHAVCIHMVKTKDCSDKNEHMAEHMVDHMYNINNISNKIHKSYKSGSIASRGIAFSGKISAPKAQAKSLQEHNEELAREAISKQTPNRKPRFVQQMMELLNKYFPEMMKNFHLTKTIARNFVAMLKYKLHWRIEEWERYLKLIATSPYLNSEKFKLSVYWILKFITIDRILGGDFGVNPDKITYTKEEKEEMVENKKQQIQQKIDDIKEPETCKQARVKVLDILGADDYHQYFENPDKCRFIDNNGEITIEFLGSEPWNFIYKAQKLKQIGIKTEWIRDYIDVIHENGYSFVYIANSFEELEQMNTSQQKEEKPQNKQQNGKEAPNSSLWKRILKVNELVTDLADGFKADDLKTSDLKVTDLQINDLNINEPENTVSETQMDCISNIPENSCFNFAY